MTAHAHRMERKRRGRRIRSTRWEWIAGNVEAPRRKTQRPGIPPDAIEGHRSASTFMEENTTSTTTNPSPSVLDVSTLSEGAQQLLRERIEAGPQELRTAADVLKEIVEGVAECEGYKPHAAA